MIGDRDRWKHAEADRLFEKFGERSHVKKINLVFHDCLSIRQQDRSKFR